jgi:hypothetical protein
VRYQTALRPDVKMSKVNSIAGLKKQLQIGRVKLPYPFLTAASYLYTTCARFSCLTEWIAEMPPARRTIIDGYNVIRTNPSGSRLEQSQGGEAARQWLIDHCLAALPAGEQWTVVFDGDGIGSCHDADGAKLAVLFAAPQTADEMIRDMGFHAAALGANCLIVSSDNDVRIDGCAFQDSSSFYDYLLRHAGRRTEQPADEAVSMVDKLLAYLAECGHIKRGDFIPSETRDALRELLRYFAAEKHKSQKIARTVESMLREGVRLKPEPDTEKTVFRNIKSFFENK